MRRADVFCSGLRRRLGSFIDDSVCDCAFLNAEMFYDRRQLKSHGGSAKRSRVFAGASHPVAAPEPGSRQQG